MENSLKNIKNRKLCRNDNNSKIQSSQKQEKNIQKYRAKKKARACQEFCQDFQYSCSNFEEECLLAFGPAQLKFLDFCRPWKLKAPWPLPICSKVSIIDMGEERRYVDKMRTNLVLFHTLATQTLLNNRCFLILTRNKKAQVIKISSRLHHLNQPSPVLPHPRQQKIFYKMMIIRRGGLPKTQLKYVYKSQGEIVQDDLSKHECAMVIELKYTKAMWDVGSTSPLFELP